MPDREKVIKGLYQHCEGSMFDRCGECPYYEVADEPFQCRDALLMDAMELLKEQENWLGIHQTVDGITFISSGTAKQGEDRGLMLGKAYMHEWLQKELLYRGLLTDEIRKVFADASSL